MKVVRYIVLILSAVLFVSAGNAQVSNSDPRYTLYGGGNFPLGDYGNTLGSDAGFAEFGLGAMADGYKQINEILYWTTTMAITGNGFNEAGLQSALSELGVLGVNAENYLTAWALSGVEIRSTPSRNLQINGILQGGALLSRFPDITLSTGEGDVRQGTKMGTSLAIGLGGGLIYNSVNIGLRYYRGRPEYDQATSDGNSTSTATTKLPIEILQVVIGYQLK
ncbi:MAG: hypothetical protein K9N46_11360 [Candidatus Marinimicrobia bacterium]|nr:hypothetical protein [Candidatus Neomarinimicrobiota bacterium]MCF7827619.1 hypothetical protein [Candidatus Neomarinimicrobiota bacterium]MCF7881326.1 hypothetical protein [Candidatus Neomarinimicrobiota bacterium]